MFDENYQSDTDTSSYFQFFSSGLLHFIVNLEYLVKVAPPILPKRKRQHHSIYYEASRNQWTVTTTDDGSYQLSKSAFANPYFTRKNCKYKNPMPADIYHTTTFVMYCVIWSLRNCYSKQRSVSNTLFNILFLIYFLSLGEIHVSSIILKVDPTTLDMGSI